MFENGVNVNLCNVNNISLFYVVSCIGYDGIVKFLIENEVDVDLCNINGVGFFFVVC